MTTTLDAILVPRVMALIERFGKLASFTVLSSSTYDPATGGVVESAEVGSPVRIKVTPPTPYARRFVGNDAMREGDIQIGFSPVAPDADTGAPISFVPVLGMDVSIDSVSLETVAVDIVYSGESVALYILTLRE